MNKLIPTGLSDYKEFIEGNFDYIDKTLFIKELLSLGRGLRLICRPRRFGKTLNLSMLRYFFEKTEKSNAHLFIDKAIWQYEECRAVQGQYPVIFITLKDIKQSTWEKAYADCITIIAEEYKRHRPFIAANVSLIDEDDFEIFNKIAGKKADYTEFTGSIKFLMHLLRTIAGKTIILLIDEYDAPIHSAYQHGYYDEMVSFMRDLLSKALNDNADVEQAVLTGILRTSKEGIFSGLNNLNVYSLLNNKFADKFGFLSHEVDALIKSQNIALDPDVIKQWYNGYRAGNDTLLYNPWSIIHCIENDGALQPYWVNTSNNNLIQKLISASSVVLKQELEGLLDNVAIEKTIDEAFIFPGIEKNDDAIWSLLLFSGYITYSNVVRRERNDFYTLVIPNEEIHELYARMLTSIFKESLATTSIREMFDALLSGDAQEVESILQEFFLTTASFHDFPKKLLEQSYHIFVLGLLAHMGGTYHVRSNRESGFGRYDIMLIPKTRDQTGILFEFKKAKADTQQAMETAVQEALEQIGTQKYIQELRAHDVEKIIAYGIGFFGKKLMVKSEWILA